MAYDDYFGGVKAPTLSETPRAYTRPVRLDNERAVPPAPEGVSRVQQVKALRTEFPGMGLKEAVDIVDGKKPRPDDPASGELVELSDAEAKAAAKALRENTGRVFDLQVNAVVAAINQVRSNDPVGTLRKSVAGQFAFAIAPGQYLVIETGERPRFKAADPSETTGIKQSWKVLHAANG
ncbi:hypothetical protein J4T99_gp091 [Mycobacterium phage Bromden]|uniref:Uncharacterized protein n=1 Tax=Mycobacterium phage Bromden TaxID=2283252 RepID=A0A345MBM5_9CAUD|nr:hypothetical protein J4T99_gp091 [Mycobacterium phage Bromden]AXH67896.1 hypothetical protein SEA_BROMDEN_91 [Mycobacterium phage Bromden]